MQLATQLRAKNLFVDFDHKQRSLKSQMRRADKMGAKSIIVIGESERVSQVANLKSLATGESRSISLNVQSIISALETS